jgi:hypothetical protein
MRELAANMLRIVRGAGRPYELPAQMAKVLNLMEDYREATGHYPSDYEIGDTINIRNEAGGRSDDWSHGIDTMVQGALQVAASTMVNQSTQKSAGEHELIEGLAQIEKIREANRRKAQGWAITPIAPKSVRDEMDRRAKELGKRKPRKPKIT